MNSEPIALEVPDKTFSFSKKTKTKSYVTKKSIAKLYEEIKK